MKTTKALLAALAAALLLAACDGGSSGNGKAALALPTLVKLMFANTSETATPAEINALPIDTSDESPTIYDALLI